MQNSAFEDQNRTKIEYLVPTYTLVDIYAFILLLIDAMPTN